MLQLSNITKSFGERVLLEDVTWQITSGERVGTGPIAFLRSNGAADENHRNR